MAITRPTNHQAPFANAGSKNTIPVSSSSPLASYTDGFPPVTMLPIVSGGIAPQGKDFNGILYDISAHTVWVNAGGQYQFDAALSTAIGGYPAGMVLQNNAGTAAYVSAVNSNTTDFNSTPSSIGSLWLPYSGSAFSNTSIATTGGATVLTAIQATAKIVTVTGTLTSNATLTFPAAVGRFTIINNTTGAFTVTAIALGGAGVPIAQGTADTLICDATNMRYEQGDTVTKAFGDSSTALASTAFVQGAISTIGGYYVDSGGVANAYIITPVPALSGSYVTGESFRIRTSRTGSGASTLDAGLGAKALILESGNPTASGDVHGLFTVVYDSTIGAGSWVMAGEAVSELGALAKENFGQGLEDDGAGNARVKLADTSLRRSSAGIQSNFTDTTFSGTRAVTSADNGNLLVATAAGTLTVAQTTTTWNGFNFTVNARGGAVTVTPNAADKINNGTVGASYTVAQSTTCEFVGDGAGNIDIVGQTTVPGSAAAAQYINTSQTVTSGVYNVDTSAGPISLTLPTGLTTGAGVVFIDYANTWSQNAVTLIPSGSDKIDNILANFTLDFSGMTAPFTYKSANWNLQ